MSQKNCNIELPMEDTEICKDEICNKIIDNINENENKSKSSIRSICELFYVKIRNKDFGKEHNLFMFAGVLDKSLNTFLTDPNVCYDVSKLGDTFPDIDLSGSKDNSFYTPKQMLDMFNIVVEQKIHKFVLDKSDEQNISIQINSI